jgi:hypothetical protein
VQGLLGFVALVCVWVHFCYCSVGCFCQGLLVVGIVGWSAGGECGRGRGSLVTG